MYVCMHVCFVILPLTPVFQTVLAYFRPETILLETVKDNLRWYRLPSLRVKSLLFDLVGNGIGKTRSGRPGHRIERLSIFTSGSLHSELQQANSVLFRFQEVQKLILKLNLWSLQDHNFFSFSVFLLTCCCADNLFDCL